MTDDAQFRDWFEGAGFDSLMRKRMATFDTSSVEPVRFDPSVNLYHSDGQAIGHEIAAKFDDWARDYEARLTPDERAMRRVLRIGQNWFDERDIKGRLEAVGVRVEVSDEGWILHLPATEGSVEMAPPWQPDRLLTGTGEAQLTPESARLWQDFYCLRPSPLATPQPDYLKHDPTKRHRRARSHR